MNEVCFSERVQMLTGFWLDTNLYILKFQVLMDRNYLNSPAIEMLVFVLFHVLLS